MNRQLISEADVAHSVEKTAEFTHATETTFFEFVTVMALQHFAEQKCDLVIWETGLGGRLDATNIVTPLASAITNISLDHQQWLGETVTKIAAEKAGIIKSGVPVVTSVAEPEALAVITKTATRLNAPLTVVDATSDTRLAGLMALPLAGDYQKLNAALAVQTVEVLKRVIPVSSDATRRGLESVNWPGRLQLITRANGQRVLLDGAHNVAGVEALRNALQHDPKFSSLAKAGCTLILGVMQDKDWRTICELLAPLAQRIVLVAVASARTAAPAALAEVCRRVNAGAEVSVSTSLTTALSEVPAKAFVVITGSLYLVGEALALISPLGTVSADERELNNWQIASAPDNRGPQVRN